MTPRTQHIKWCQHRALQYVTAGELGNALASMGSDMALRPDTKIDPHFYFIGALHVRNGDAFGLQRWIEGFQ